MKNYLHFSTKLFFHLLLIYSLISHKQIIAQASSLSEGFDVMLPANWVAINHSTGSGINWFQGDIRKFYSYGGDSNSYAAASYQSIDGPAGTGTISNWLVSPELNLQNGATISFWTRTVTGSLFPDRLEIRLSTNGASSNVGTGTEGVGDFTNLLLSINPLLQVGGYPDTGWTQYALTLSGLPSGFVPGRIAFRYYVTDAGPSGTNSNYIGVDEFSYETTLPVHFLNFDGILKNNQAMLTWSTASEINNKGFEVQKSRDNLNYSTIGFVNGQNNTSDVSSYYFTDTKLLSGSNYYRLKQVDFDGNSKYSSVIKLDFKKFDWAILGNPSQSNTWVQLQTDKQYKIKIQVISLSGEVIQTINKGYVSAGTYSIPLNLSNASGGVYIVRFFADKNVYSKKFIK